MSEGSGGGKEDDGIDLVQQVLAENPPEEKGEREEWAQHVGWHRKEDIHRVASLRGTSNADTNGSKQANDLSSPATNSAMGLWDKREMLIQAGCAVISLACLVVLFRKLLLLSSARRRRSKNR